MTLLVGAILLLIFLGFAVLMFLERMSALLALPLMAVAFLFAAACADLVQPPRVVEMTSTPSVDGLGRKTITAHKERVTSRFGLWKQVRLEQARILRNRTALLTRSVERLEAALGGPPDTVAARISDALSQVRAEEEELRKNAYQKLDELPALFSQPPEYGGQRSRFDEAFRAIAITDSFLGIADGLDTLPRAELIPKVRNILDRVRDDSERFSDRYASLPAPDSPGFRAASAFTYVLNYFVLVLRAGSLRLHAAIIATVFGGMFAMYVRNLKVAERLIYWTAEFAGERPVVIGLAVFLVTAGIFTSVGGLGTVIMLGTIILPVLRSVGMGPIVSAGTFLIAISMGGTLHPVARRLWIDFYGVDPSRLDSILWTLVGLYLACGVGWIWWGTRRSLLSSFHATPVHEPPGPEKKVPARLMMAPLIPVVLVYFARLEEITAFTVSLAYMYLCVCRRPGAVRVFSRSLIEGAQAVMPPILLMVGIGILVTALSTAPVQGYLQPLLAAVVPDSRLGYIALFALAAPLALYRGPLNVWGMGLAISAILLATSTLAPAAILCAILSAGMLQGVCDPTNTANVWIAGFQGVTVNQILRRTLLPVWVTAAIAVVIFGFRFVGT
jgi:hypothetical protein